MLWGALIGAVVGAAIEVIGQKMSGKPIDWGRVGQAALVGAVAGLVGGAVAGRLLQTGANAASRTVAAARTTGQVVRPTVARRVVAYGAGGGAGGASARVTDNALEGRPLQDGVVEATALGVGLGVVAVPVEAGLQRVAGAVTRRVRGGPGPSAAVADDLAGAADDVRPAGTVADDAAGAGGGARLDPRVNQQQLAYRQGTPIKPTDQQGGYHGTSDVDPQRVLREGLPGRGRNLDLVDHAEPTAGASSSEPSAFRGTTQNVADPNGMGQGAAEWAGRGGVVFDIRQIPSWELSTVLDDQIRTATGGFRSSIIRGEVERAIPARVYPWQIRRYGVVEETGTGRLLVREWVENPNFGRPEAYPEILAQLQGGARPTAPNTGIAQVLGGG